MVWFFTCHLFLSKEGSNYHGLSCFFTVRKPCHDKLSTEPPCEEVEKRREECQEAGEKRK